MNNIPVIWREVGDPKLTIKTPYTPGHSARVWLNTSLPARAHGAEYVGNGQWRISRKYYAQILDACIREYGSVKVVWDSSEREACTVQCQTANPETVHDCECVCGGQFHGNPTGDGWKNVEGDLLIASQTRRREWIETRKIDPPAPVTAPQWSPTNGQRRWQDILDEMEAQHRSK